jgi:ABC-type sugar transport system permease subunit
MTGHAKFIGFDNFKNLFIDNMFITGVGNTWFLWLMNFIPQLGLALLLSAWFTNVRLRIRGGGTWRMLFYLPNLLMPATIAALFFSLFSYYGPVNQILVRGGILPEAYDFIRNAAAMRSLVISIQTWMWFGWTTIILMAAMMSISVSIFEAALADGASSWQLFRYISLPLIKPVLVFVLVTSLVGGMQMFDIPYLLTDGRGSPTNSILTNNILMYMKFRSSQGHIGAASSVGVMVFIMTSICALLIFYLLRDKDASKVKSKTENR